MDLLLVRDNYCLQQAKNFVFNIAHFGDHSAHTGGPVNGMENML